MTFEQWMRQVDDLTWQQAGCGTNDLPNASYRDWYEDGLSPDEAAERAVEET